MEYPNLGAPNISNSMAFVSLAPLTSAPVWFCSREIRKPGSHLKDGPLVHPDPKPAVSLDFSTNTSAVLSSQASHPLRGKTRLAKWYAPYSVRPTFSIAAPQHPIDPALTSHPFRIYLTSIPGRGQIPPPPRNSPSYRPPRPKVPIQLRRIPVAAPEDSVSTVCRPLLLRLRRCQRQRARLPRSIT